MRSPITWQQLYEEMSPDFPEDRWHGHVTKVIPSFIDRYFPLRLGHNVLNIGCGGFHYGWSNLICIDAFAQRLSSCEHGVSAMAEMLPFKSSQFNILLCVGSVINYTNAFLLLKEMHRVIVPNGILILEFERSESIIYRGNIVHNINYWPVSVKYKGIEHTIYVYSERYIRALLEHFHFEVTHARRAHILSSVAFSIIPEHSICSPLSIFDILFSNSLYSFPLGANICLICKANTHIT